VGYRYFTEKGDKFDNDKQLKYFGWFKKYDEWIHVSSPRLRVAGYMTSILSPNNTSGHDYIDDTNDESISIEGVHP